MTESQTHLRRRSRHHRAGLVLISAYKLLAASLFVAVGVGALRLLHKDVNDFASHLLLEVLHWSPESHLVQFLLDKAELVNDPMLKRIGFGAFCYAAVGVAEAVGLYLEKAWGEFLTVIITASFLPIEVTELVHRVSVVRVAILAINIAVFIYLLYLLGERGAHRARARRAGHTPS